jgi:dihydrofolate reductase
MSRVVSELSMSLDGYIAGPGVTFEEPLGRGGEQLFDWLYAERSADRAQEFEVEYYSRVGALIIGRRMADVGIEHWGDNPTFHAPCFVLTHRPHAPIIKEGGTTYTFVTDGLEAALERARAAAGDDADVQVNGGAETIRQYLQAGWLDELRINLVPVVLGSGTSLFDGLPTGLRFTPTRVVDEPRATRIAYTVTNNGGS